MSGIHILKNSCIYNVMNEKDPYKGSILKA